MLRFAFALLLLAPLATPSAAQGGGFSPGEMYLVNPSLQSGPTPGGLVRISDDGSDSSLVIPLFNVPSNVGNMAYDTWRQRLIVRASLGSGAAPVRLWALNSVGAGIDLGLTDEYSSFAPTGDGRIYMRNHLVITGAPIVGLDASSEPFTLMNLAGSAPFNFDGNPGLDVRGMIYDPGTNALFVACSGPGGACPGGPTDKLTVRKIPLSADGSRVGGPTLCTSVEVSSSGETPVGWSYGPSGKLILVADTNSNAQEPRMLQVDPVTLGVSTWASNGSYGGAASTNAGSYSNWLVEVVILDTLNDTIRSFSQGQTGSGNQYGATGPFSAAGGSGEQPTLVDIPDLACDGGWGPYGSGLAGAGGLRPRLVGVGCPQINGAFNLKIDRVVGGASGLLFVGLGPTSLPFKGGSFLLSGVILQAAIAVGGTPGSPGAGSLTLPAGLPNSPGLIGFNIYMQLGFSDAAAVKGVSLSKGLRMEIG